MVKCCFCGKDAGEYGNNARPLKDGVCCDDCNNSKVIPARLDQMGVLPVAKHVEVTGVAGVTKDRWECPHCRANNSPECRFNLSIKKRNTVHQCRFCKLHIVLEYKK